MPLACGERLLVSGKLAVIAHRLTRALGRPAIAGACAIIAILAFLSAFSHTPINVYAQAMHDDGLYIRLGLNLIDGAWLGQYDQFTLAKGPGYPFFLALNAWLGVPITFGHALFHCLASGVLAYAIMRAGRSHLLGLLVLLLLLWNPTFLTQRVMREAIYVGQMFIVFGLAFYALFIAATEKQRALGSTLAGLLLGWSWLTREEGWLLVPSLAVLLACALWMRVKRRAPVRTVWVAVAIAAITFLVSIAAFQVKNRIVYGSFVGVDFREGDFVSAVAALQSVRSEPPRPYLPVSRGNRERIYAVSPAFATLREHLDSPEGSPWQYGCGLWKWTCGDIGGGWFLWALRDAAAAQGHYRSPSAASNFFRAVAAEVEEACASGKLTCERSMIPYMPMVTSEQLLLVPKKLANAFQVLYTFAPPDGPSVGSREELSKALRFLNYPFHTQPEYPHRYVFSGWYFDGSAEWFSIEARTAQGDPAPTRLRRLRSPDLVSAFGSPFAMNQRFSFEVVCDADCRLLFRKDDTLAEISIRDLVTAKLRGTSGHALGKGKLWFDTAANVDAPRVDQDPRANAARALRAFLAAIALALTPLLLILGAFSFAVGVFRAIRYPAPERVFALLSLATGLWVFVASRILALVMIDISAFPAINHLYMSPASYLAPVAALVSIWALVAIWGERRHAFLTERPVPPDPI